VDRQYGYGNSKYVVIFDPLPTGHVTRGMRTLLPDNSEFVAVRVVNTFSLPFGLTSGYLLGDATAVVSPDSEPSRADRVRPGRASAAQEVPGSAGANAEPDCGDHLQSVWDTLPCVVH